ncbi:HPr family phosphocarrier protein [bacterium]|nr:HPr family phosphocarrier protein [candidate division CSSED10-310 bacterium]
MKSMFIQLASGQSVKKFVSVISQFNGSFELVSDRTVLDAKSILGIYSLDLSKPILLRIEHDDNDNLDLLLEFRAQ